MEHPDSRPQHQPPPAPPPVYPSQPARRMPLFAAMLSVVPGLGNVYNGLYVRGIALFFLVNGLFALAFRIGSERDTEHQLALIIPTTIFFWLFNLFDAYRQATLINLGRTTDLGLEDQPQLPRYASGSMVLGVALAVVGLYGLLAQMGVNMSFLFDYWYVVLMAFGGTLIYQSVKAQRSAEAGADVPAYLAAPAAPAAPTESESDYAEPSSD